MLLHFVTYSATLHHEIIWTAYKSLKSNSWTIKIILCMGPNIETYSNHSRGNISDIYSHSKNDSRIDTKVQ